MPDVICFGSCVLDIFIETEAELVTINNHNHTDTLIAYELGSKIDVKNVTYELGGSATNASVCFSRLGFKTAFLGLIGKDHTGEELQIKLKRENVKFIGKQEGTSGTSFILDSQASDRTILSFKGCNAHFTKDMLPKKIDTKWLFCTAMIGESWETMKEIVKKAHEEEIMIALSPNESLMRMGIAEISKVLSYCEVVVLNKNEATLFAGEYDSAELCLRIKDAGPKTVAITNGKDGATIYHEGQIYEAKPAKVSVVETTGAGDAFASSLVAGLMMKLPFEECIKLAFVNAESVISYRGAQNILLSREEAMKRVKVDTRNITIRKI